MTVLRVEVAYSPGQGEVDHVTLDLPEGSTVADALRLSGLFERHPNLQAAAALGVWGRRCDAARVLRDRDRVEVYRGLTVDPKDARRRRQQTQPKRPRRPGVNGSPTR